MTLLEVALINRSDESFDTVSSRRLCHCACLATCPCSRLWCWKYGFPALHKSQYIDNVTDIASISAIEGKNWRHGDIEDVLKTVAFIKGHKWTSMMIKRVYFG